MIFFFTWVLIDCHVLVNRSRQNSIVNYSRYCRNSPRTGWFTYDKSITVDHEVKVNSRLIATFHLNLLTDQARWRLAEEDGLIPWPYGHENDSISWTTITLTKAKSQCHHNLLFLANSISLFNMDRDRHIRIEIKLFECFMHKKTTKKDYLYWSWR